MNALKASLASAALVSAACMIAAPASANGYSKGQGKSQGSLKDSTPYAYQPPRAAAGPCYFRADVGYSLSSTPNVSWPVLNEIFDDGDDDGDGIPNGDDADYGGNENGTIDAHEVSYEHAGSNVSNVDIDDAWFGDVGVGCGQGSHGFRVEAVLGLRGSKDIKGDPAIYEGSVIGQPTPGHVPEVIDDPLHTDVTSYTMMLNVYKDLGKWGSFVPYVGAGLGVAYHRMGETYFTQNPNLVNRIEGNNDLAFAWSLMAGLAYQISDRAVMDFGYRYIDMGKIESGRLDSGGFGNPAVVVDDLASHEFKVGLRYHFGGGSQITMPASYTPLK